ncbi:MAG: DUF427 domain-containing protein [Chloroflexota bacterium]
MRQEVQNESGWAEFIPSPRWVRAKFANQYVADSKQVMLLRQTGSLPVYHFPQENVRLDLLTPNGESRTHSISGERTYLTLQVGDQTVEKAAWRYDAPAENGLDLTGYIAFRWEAIDAWFEEADQIYRHARDPHKRIDVALSSRHIQIVIGGETVADSRRARLLFETGLPTRYYIPPEDVRMELLSSTNTTSQCPYKGIASYYSVTTDSTQHEDIAWYYPFPIPECPKIENLICFFNERVEAVIVDGEIEEKVATPWSVASKTTPIQAEREASVKAAQIYIPDQRRNIHASPRHVRAQFAGQWVADSKTPYLAREDGHWLREYYFSTGEVQQDLLVKSEKTAVSSTFGPLAYFHLQVGDRLAENAVRMVTAPPAEMAQLQGYFALDWKSMDAWFEESDQVYVHARDPFARLDVLNSPRHIQVSIDGTLVADTKRACLLFETGLPTRYYIPKEDIRQELLRPSSQQSQCPYKGIASYYSVQIGDQIHKDIAWYYPFPIPEIPKIENLVCFYNELVDIRLDGELEPRPQTHFV